MGRLPDSDKSVRSKYRLKINLSACRFENKVQFCNPEKTVLDARPASDYFSVYATTFGDLRRTGAEKRIAVDGYRLLDNIANDQTCIRTLRSIPYINGICFLIPEIGFGDYIFIPFMADLKGCMAFRSKEFTAIPCIIVFLN